MSGPSAGERQNAAASFFLPDFCAAGTVLAVVLIAELVALLLTIARQPIGESFWIELARISLFLLWIALTSAAVLCRSRAWLAPMSVVKSSAIMLVLLVLTVATLSEVVFRLGQVWGAGTSGAASLFPAEHGRFLLGNVAIGFIVSALTLRYFYVASEWKRSVELEARSRIRALQARIRPHFLFNSMNTIAALTRSDPARAEEAVEDLADLFRANLSETRSHITLKEELEVARIYQRIEQLRLGERLKVSWDVAELPMRALVPSLLVQPLLENAVYHGIEALPAGGTIMVSGRFDGDTIELELTNPVPLGTNRSERAGNRLALDNIRERLELAWPGRSAVSVDDAGQRYRVTLTFPFQERAE